jgi:hypothetical protein
MPERFSLKYLFLLFITGSAISGNAQQHKGKWLVGINLHTLPANSYELSSAYTLKPNWELTLKGGYTGKRGLRFQNDVGDSYDDKTHSGYFFKSGARFIFKQRFFLSAEVILSHYNNTGWYESDGSQGYHSSKGTIVGFGLSPGFRFPIKERWLIDLGTQFALAQNRNDYVGSVYHNYQPGLGSLEGKPYLQGICVIMLKL